MNHLRAAWAQRIVGYSGPIGGIGLKELWDAMQAMFTIQIEFATGRVSMEFILAREKVPFGANFKQVVERLTAEAATKVKDQVYQWPMKPQNHGFSRFVLLAHGRNETFLVGETQDLADWEPPRRSFQTQHRMVEPFGTFLSTLYYGTNDEVARLWAEEIADVPYDDSQFDLIEGNPHVVIYRGMGLQKDDDPTTSSNPDTGGVGYSWTLSEDTAMAIAMRGMAGFSGDNAPRDSYGLSLSQEQRGAIRVPTMLRAEVVLTGEAAKPYRPWNWSYRSELEIDVPKGTPIVVTGWKQAKARPLSQKLYDRAHAPGVDPLGPEGVWYVTWEWGSWHTGAWKRTASV